MLIRPATANDLTQLMALARRVVPMMRASRNLQWDDTYPNEDVFMRDIDRGDLWLAVGDSGEIVGVAAITTDQSPEYVDAGWDINEAAIVIHRLAVDPEVRRAGIGFALMQHAERIARERGVARLLVDTSAENVAAQQLILRCGYKYAGEIGLHFRPGLRVFCYEKFVTLSKLRQDDRNALKEEEAGSA